MATALPALELHFWCQLRIASARPILGPSGPCARVVVHVYVDIRRAGQWLAIGLNTIQWTAEACLAAAGHTYYGFGCRLASYGAPTALRGVHRALPRACVRWSQESKCDLQPMKLTHYLLLDVYFKGRCHGGHRTRCSP